MQVSYQLKVLADIDSVHQWILQHVAATDEEIEELRKAAQASLDKLARQEAEEKRHQGSNDGPM